MTQLLTSRQQDILVGLWNGDNRKELAARLGVSPYTVSAHITSLRKRLDARTTEHLMRRGVERGVLTI